jgi:hypothetical protein
VRKNRAEVGGMVMVLWMGKCVKKIRAEDEDGALDWKLCTKKQDRGWWQCQDGRVHEERKDRDDDGAVDEEACDA